MSDDDNIVDLPIKPKPEPDQERTLERVYGGDCWHARFLIDEKRSEVECGDCHERLNPMWVLGQLANKESRWSEKRRKLLQVMKEAENRTRFKCRSCGSMNDLTRIVKIKRA